MSRSYGRSRYTSCRLPWAFGNCRRLRRAGPIKDLCSVDGGYRANGRAAATTNLERQALKMELTPSDEVFKIAQPLIVRDASIAAGSMVRKQVVGRPVGGRALDTMQPGSPVGQPVCRRRRYTRVAPHGFFGRKVAVVETSVEEHDVSVDRDLGLSFCGFKVGDIDLAKVANVGQIQADGFAHEHVQR